MGENQQIEKLLEKLDQLMKAKTVNNLTLMVKGTDEVLQISAKELKKLRQLKQSATSPKQSGRTTILGNLVNLAQTEKGISSQASTSASSKTCRSSWILDSGASADRKSTRLNSSHPV